MPGSGPFGLFPQLTPLVNVVLLSRKAGIRSSYRSSDRSPKWPR